MKVSSYFLLLAVLSLLFLGCEEILQNTDPVVTDVTVSPSTTTVAKGANKTFTAAVTGQNDPAQTVTWSVTGGVTGTAITSAGVLSVSANETTSTLTVKATSTVDTTKSGTATVTVTVPDGITFTNNTGGNAALSGSPYGYEMWTEGGNNNKLIWYGPNQRGGAAFRAEWNNPNDFLGRVGYFWGNGGSYTTYKNIYVDFAYTRSGRSTAGNYSYIGIYGWSRNPLIEYYIVEDWFGNQWQSDTTPMGTATTGGSEAGSFTVDGATYKIIKNTRTNAPSINGTATFTQYFSIRQTPRKSGTISVTKHFEKWAELSMELGNMYECKFLVEAGGGTGWLELSNLEFFQENTPRN